MTENNTAVPLEIKLNIIPKTTEQNQAPANQKKPWFFVNFLYYLINQKFLYYS